MTNTLVLAHAAAVSVASFLLTLAAVAQPQPVVDPTPAVLPDRPSEEVAQSTSAGAPPTSAPQHVGKDFPSPGSLQPAPPNNATTTGVRPSQAELQQRFDDQKKELDEAVSALIGVPEIPAAYVLGLTTTTVARPSSTREAAGELSSVIGPGGKLKPGAAIEVAPLLRLTSRDATVESWRHQRWRGILGSWRLSLATGTDPDVLDDEQSPTLLALGTRIGYDGTDIRYHDDEVSQLRKGLNACTPGGGQVRPTSREWEVTPVAPAEGCNFRDLRQKVMESVSGFQIEAAGTFVLEDTTAEDTDADVHSAAAWLSAEWRIISLLGVGGAIEHRRKRAEGADDIRNQGGLRLDLNTEAFGLSLSGAYQRRSGIDGKYNWLATGGSLAANAGKWGALKLGVQGSRRLGDDTEQSDLVAMVVLASASGEPIFSRYVGGGKE